MKLTVLLLVVSIFSVNANGYGQKTKVTIDLDHVEMREVLETIESLTDFKFLYNNKKIDAEKLVSVSAKNKPVSEVLDELFKGTTIYYVLRKKQIILKTKSSALHSALLNESPLTKDEGIVQRTVSGTVTDGQGVPLSGANIVEKGTSNGVTADFDGNFSLNVSDENAILVVSYIGFATKEVAIGGQTTISISLEESTAGLDEVVVVGYGTMKKVNLTSSISKITDEALADRPIVSVGEAFQGQLAGVRAQNTGGGVPGEELTIRIRGMNTINGDSNPLYVIDGVPRNSMSDINPNDIATIQVLKDASATSIYGSRGGNGVVLIETKQGKGEPKVTFESYGGLSTSEKKLDIMNGEEWVAWNIFRRNLNHLRGGGSMQDPMSERVANNRIPGTWETTTNFTDWQEAILKAAPIQSYQVSASAGGDIGNIYFSAGYMNQEGIIKYSYYKRKNIRLNANLNIGKKLVVGVNVGITNSDKDGADANGGSNGNGKESAPHHALMLSPLMRLDQGTRDWGFPENIGTTYPNPVEQLKYTTDNTKNVRLASAIWAEYSILDNLVFKSQYSYNYDGYTYEFYQPGNVTYNNGNVTRGNSTSTTTGNWTFQNTLTYDRAFGEHHVNILLGQSMEEQKYYRIYAAASGWPYESIETLNVATTPTSATTNRTTYSNASAFARANYNFKERYLITATVRYDGSSRFGSNSKWGYFPSVSAGWKLNEESFLKDVDWLSLLKTRVAWGLSGNDRIGDYSYMALLGIYNTSWGDKVVSGVGPNRIANEDLQWESTSTLDFGLDVSMFKNRIQMNFDYYRNKTSNLLFSVPIPYATGFSSFTTNIGSIENRGWEVDISSSNIRGSFNWSTDLNLSRNTNKVLDMGAIDKFTSSSWDAQFITQIGGPVSQFFVYRTDGVLTASDFDGNGDALVPILAGQEEGNVKYVDQNDDKIINSGDYVPYGSNLPDLIYGLTNRFSWKNIDLSILIQGQEGGDVLFMGQRQYDNGGANTNGFNRWLGSYKPDYESLYGAGENPIPEDYINEHGIDFAWDGKTPNPVGKNDNNDDRRIYDASYLRIKNITLGYNLPKDVFDNSFLKDVRCYMSVDNLITFDDYPGYSPETNSFGNSTTMMGVDYSTYPLSRRFVIGVTIKF